MPKLAKVLWDEKDEPFQIIASKVMREVSLQFEQQCNSDDRLNVGPLYLQKKLSSRIGVPDAGRGGLEA